MLLYETDLPGGCEERAAGGDRRVVQKQFIHDAAAVGAEKFDPDHSKGILGVAAIAVRFVAVHQDELVFVQGVLFAAVSKPALAGKNAENFTVGRLCGTLYGKQGRGFLLNTCAVELIQKCAFIHTVWINIIKVMPVEFAVAEKNVCVRSVIDIFHILPSIRRNAICRNNLCSFQQSV